MLLLVRKYSPKRILVSLKTIIGKFWLSYNRPKIKQKGYYQHGNTLIDDKSRGERLT